MFQEYIFRAPKSVINSDSLLQGEVIGVKYSDTVRVKGGLLVYLKVHDDIGLP
jgi:hypothetical protein